MRVLYVGQYTDGTTSKMRAVALRNILQPTVFEVIDTHIPFFKTHRIWRSLAFRYKLGPTIKAINSYIIDNLEGENFDLIWIDKATFLNEETIKKLKSIAKNLVHFSPDMMFYENKSKTFIKSLQYFDLVVTTKSRELELYEKYVDRNKIKWVTQGFDSEIHRSVTPFNEKKNNVVFIGLAEPSREEVIQFLIDQDIEVNLAGKGWLSFVKKNSQNTKLTYLGESLVGLDYSSAISESKFALGLISKRFPELHTTRTLEIPACGSVLLTEKNDEIKKLFYDDEVIYFNDLQHLVGQIRYFLKFQDKLETIAQKGQKRVLNSAYDYNSIIRSIINSLNLF